MTADDNDRFERFVAAQAARVERRRQFVLSKMVEAKGGEVETSYGKMIVSKNCGPDRAVYPWRVTTILSDGRPSGHEVFKLYDLQDDGGPFYRSAVGEAASQVRMPEGTDPVVRIPALSPVNSAI